MGRKAKRARVLARKARLEMKAAGLVEETPVVSEPVVEEAPKPKRRRRRRTTKAKASE